MIDSGKPIKKLAFLDPALTAQEAEEKLKGGQEGQLVLHVGDFKVEWAEDAWQVCISDI